MSDLDELIEAAGQRPSAGLLRIVIATAGAGGQGAEIVGFLAGLAPQNYDPDLRETVARLLLDEDAAQAALAWTGGEEGALAILRARALLRLDRVGEAREGYQAALALFPQLRDAALDQSLATAQAVAAAPCGSASGNVVALDPRRRAIEMASEEPAFDTGHARVDFQGIGGLDDVKNQIRRRIILPFERRGIFDRFKRRAGGGVLLYGPPGCGKTLLARATASECGASFTAVEITDVLDKWLGESEKHVAALFAEARARRPAVLFFDEVEALASRRRFSEHSYQSSMVSTFLNQMDGFKDDNDGILVLAATNTPWAIDAAFRRPGRFDRSLFVPPPDRVAREAILSIALKDRPVASALSLAGIADRTSGFSGADLVHLVETACDLAIERSIAADSVAPITGADLREALKTVKPTTGEWLTQARNYAKFANEGGFYDDVAAFLDKHAR
ncbi:26S protease regulatory subunit [Aurantimonas sp. VKM B-3413]|uniref:ATP-binding protein n=1 Tax=Aurantimonas sp. VKM B-3413 TaxID=2779401 RepID=UPI001E37A962|nr:ATP-binding protein [Aurantimonas sp. VKM B-3413]MCB8840834.1 ATP-binding protein [Aurantimonas sp. VKM B-3413]